MLDEFHAGVTACLRSWSALRTAVESGWGGGVRESQEKAEQIRRTILEIMDGRACPIPNFSMEDLSDELAIYMEEEFSVTLEDDSEKQVAEAIFKMYEGCYRGDPTLARHMVAQAESAVVLSTQFPVQVQTTEHDDDDDDDQMIDAEPTGSEYDPAIPLANPVNPPTAMMELPADYTTAPLFGPMKQLPSAPTVQMRQLGEAVVEEPAVEVDDDGFAPVKPKGRRRN